MEAGVSDSGAAATGERRGPRGDEEHISHAMRPAAKRNRGESKRKPRESRARGEGKQGETEGKAGPPKGESTGKAWGKQRESQGKADPKKGKPVLEGGNGPIIYSTGVLRNRPESTLYNIKRAKTC